MSNRSRYIVLLSTLTVFVILSAWRMQNKNMEATLVGDPKKVEKLKVPAGFKAEHLYSPSENNQGSWVAMTWDDKGRMITADQYGALYRLTIPKIGESGDIKVEKLVIGNDPSKLGMGYAQGILFAFNSIYVNVNHNGNAEFDQKSGLYRLQDTNGDDQFDKVTLIKPLPGEPGEHGPHSLVLTPDKKSILVVAGNHTDLPNANIHKTPAVWKEDNMFPQIKDPRGHAANRKAPGGWIAKIDPDGKNWELIAAGFRNKFDVAFNEAGDLFAYDADMEWDFGLPWYRPTRLNHVIDGAEFGWRTGNGKWSPSFPDNLPAVVNFGPGSPTNLVSLKDANFPDQYKKNTVVAFDWTYGIMYAVHLEPQGSTYTSHTEEFVSGTPLSLTDGMIGPDGNLYFLAGGRRLESDLYRLSYPGSNNAKVAVIEPNAANKLRRSIEAYHEKKAGAVAFAWPYLKNEDRFIRFAARVAVEHQPISEWKDLALKEKNPVALVETTIALAHQGDSTMVDQTLQAVMTINFKSLPENQKIDVLRAIELVVLRLKTPSQATKEKLFAYLDSNYPAPSNAVNRGLARILVYMEAPGATAKTVNLMLTSKDEPLEQGASAYNDLIMRNPQYGNDVARMLASTPPRQQITLAMMLSEAKSGWTPELQEKYFSWYTKAYTYRGGNSYIGYISRSRENALKHVAPDKVAHYDELSGGNLLVKTTTTGGRGGRGQQGGNALLDATPQPVGPGKNYTMELVQPWVGEELTGRNFENGKKMFDAALCSTCHQFQGKGSNIGPDLTALGTRFSQKDILDNIINPSKVISDQYGTSIILLKSGTSVLGRVVNEDAKNVYVSQNPFAPDQLRTVPKDQIVSTKMSETSSMLPGTLNRLNEEEVKDLLAYLVSGGNPAHKAFLPAGAK